MHKVIIISLALFSLSLFMLSGVGTAQPETHSKAASAAPNISSAQTSIHVVVYSTYGGSQYDIFVPVNSTGAAVYPIWHIQLYGQGAFTFSVNGTQVESGFSLGVYNLTYTFTGGYANATLIFNGKYTFNFFSLLFSLQLIIYAPPSYFSP